MLNHLEQVGTTAPTHLTFWDIRRAFDSVPKWLQRLAWARLGLSPEDLEWFLRLDSSGDIIIRTPYQQQIMARTRDMDTGKMLTPSGHSFHPDRGIGQGDTPSTLLFIAVFDILLTLLENSDTGVAHAYADDLVHMAPTIELQQKHADLVCGFCAFTGLEISLKKVEVVSINHGGIARNTPFLVLRDWSWRPHRVQHTDEGYWIRYLGLFLDKHACGRHFTAAKLKFRTLCRLLARKVAPPAAKRLVYALCLKSQIRYPAGLAPWSTHQYLQLDRIPAALLRNIYGLRRTFPADLIYAPETMGGCGESRISDTAQLQKWHYLHSAAHLGRSSADTVSALLQRALSAQPTDPTYFCTSLVDWGRKIGLTLSQAQAKALPLAVVDFMTQAASVQTRPIYSDGSFAVTAPLIDTLSLSSTALAHSFGKAATAVYLPATDDQDAIALVIRTHASNSTDAYYQELLGTSVTTLLSTCTPLLAFSDCSSAIRRTQQALYALGPAIGHLQHGSLLLGIRALASKFRHPSTLAWVPSHPERTKDQRQWTDADWGIHTADALAGFGPTDSTPSQTFYCDSEELHAALTPPGTWQWLAEGAPFHGSLQKRAQQAHFRQYTKTRDMKRIYANEPLRWANFCTPLMATLTHTKRKSPRHVGRRTKHVFDWMAHATNLAKGSPADLRTSQARCRFCAVPETQQHINAACTHPPMKEMRHHHKRCIDEFFQCYRHQHLPASDRWIIPLIDYMEDHLWADNEAGGDIWNGRWTPQLLSSLLGDSSQLMIESRDCRRALTWLQKLTGLLQKAQRAIYGVRHAELMSLEAKIRRATVIAMHRKRKIHTARTLFAVWNIPYVKPPSPRRRALPPPSPLAQAPPTLLQPTLPGQWVQHSKAQTTATPLFKASTRKTHMHKHRKREEHRSSKLKLRKLRNILILCR